MSILSQFAFQSNQVRVLVLGDEPWFVASDVAKVLEYVKVDKMLQLVDEEASH
jgi:prophage antirepressor-like protein